LNNIDISFQNLLELINRIPAGRCCWIAYSGGIDSTVLLHFIYTHRDKVSRDIRAVHVNHNISKFSDEWAEHCKQFCNELNIRFELLTLDARNYEGFGPEAYARELRYATISRLLSINDILLTAHHRDDLAETFILQLMRGAGPEGLAGIPQIREFGPGWIIRPFLEYTREQLNAYAIQNSLQWIEDESNSDLSLDRNYIRNQLIPYLQQHWPAVSRTLARSANHQADLLDILRYSAEIDLNNTMAESVARKRNLLRYWLKINNKPAATSTIIEEIIINLVDARHDSHPLISWSNTEIRRYRDRIYLMQALPQIDNTVSYTWILPDSLDIKFGRLEAKQTTGSGIKIESLVNNIINVRFRHGGEEIKPAGRKESHKLKKMYQQAGIPPWKRDRIPLLYINDELASVTGCWIDQKFHARDNERGWEISLIEY
jgi:tRNA(Ile)-lysidine synthase